MFEKARVFGLTHDPWFFSLLPKPLSILRLLVLEFSFTIWNFSNCRIWNSFFVSFNIFSHKRHLVRQLLKKKKMVFFFKSKKWERDGFRVTTNILRVGQFLFVFSSLFCKKQKKNWETDIEKEMEGDHW